MQPIRGTLKSFLCSPTGEVKGAVLDTGTEVHFVSEYADLFTSIASEGSPLQIEGDARMEGSGQRYLHRALITNLDSKKTASLPALVCLGKAGMPSDSAPNRAASLSPFAPAEAGARRESPSGDDQQLIDAYFESLGCKDHSSAGATAAANPARRATRTDAAQQIEQAYDQLHRIQAILAYLNIVKREMRGTSQILDEARHTYQQALARYEAHDFEGAREFAVASESLSRVVEIIISRTLRSDSSYPSLVPPPPEHPNTTSESDRVQSGLHEVESVLSRIHWLMEHGTLPLEDRTQVRKIASWGEALHHEARRMYRSESLEDATELMQAANAAVHSAEHVCRKWYLSHAIGG